MEINENSMLLDVVLLTGLSAMLVMFQCVCQKCGLDTVDSEGDVIWLCMLCSEQREVSAVIS